MISSLLSILSFTTIAYDTEWQTDFEGRCLQVGLLQVGMEIPLTKHVGLQASALSISRSRDERLLDDRQVFSNIEEADLPLALAVAGVEWQMTDGQTLFVGVRNLNEDYFTSPLTSLFTNSSCGIFPTLSYNLPLANYPLAAMGLHYAYHTGGFGLQASAYNGQGYLRWTGPANVWRVTPCRDGAFGIVQAEWEGSGWQYFVGGCVHTGLRDDPAVRSMAWTYLEGTLSPRLSLIADYSHAFGHDCQCLDFVGLGLQFQPAYSRNRQHRLPTLGLFTDGARYSDQTEWATELTLVQQLSDKVSVQASCHLINLGSWQAAGLIRLSIRL